MPHFSLEVQGETNPLTLQAVLSTLSQAYAGGPHGHQQSLQVATEQLSNWERQAGYYLILQEIFADLSLDQQLRFQAVIQLKNGIDKHWRKTSTNAISKEEKTRIRSRAINTGIQEPQHILALQNALMIGKIARYDFPHDWPDAVTVLTQEMRKYGAPGESPGALTNVLNITLQVIKELAAGRLQRTRKSLQQVSLELLQVVGGIYIKLFDKWISFLPVASDSTDELRHAMSTTYSALKILRRLLIAGFEQPHREKDVQRFWIILQCHQDLLWSLTSQIRPPHPVIADLLTKHLFQLSKVDLDMARTHAASFVLLPDSMKTLGRAWNTTNNFGAILRSSSSQDMWTVKGDWEKNEEVSPLEKLALKALLLLRACVKMVFNPAQTFKYQHPQDKEDQKAAVNTIRSEVLTTEFVVTLMETLITQYFVLRSSELRNWENEPDEWEKREEEITEAWEFSVRSCSEKLFLDLVINFKTLLVPRLLQVFQEFALASSTDIMIKESLYSAIGIAAVCLEDSFDFNHFLQGTLLQEVQTSKTGYNIIRRRSAILLGQWVPIKPGSLDRQVIYQIFSFLLNKRDTLNDAVVRVTAGRQLRLVLEPFEFKFEDFAPYANHIFHSMMALIAETEMSETKLALLETVRVGVTKLEDRIEPYADDIISMLPPLWMDSGEEHLMKQAILTMVTAIVTSLGQKSVMYHARFMPLIRDSVQPGSETIVYMLEDALDLWAAVLQQSPAGDPLPSSELQFLSECLMPLFENGSDSLRQILEITESHILLSPRGMLGPNILFPLLTALGALLGTIRSTRARDASLAPHVVETMVQCVTSKRCFPDDNGREQALQQLVAGMLESRYLIHLLSILKEAYDYHLDPLPAHKPPDIIGVGETGILSILARLMLAAPQATVVLLGEVKADLPPNWILTEWINHFDSIGDTQKKKLHCLAITNFLIASTPPPDYVLEQLQGLMTIWADVLTELQEDALAIQAGDYLWQGPEPNNSAWPGESPEDERKRKLTEEDAVFSVNVRQSISERLAQAISAVGGSEIFAKQWTIHIDEAVLKAFMDLDLPLSA